VAMAHRAGPTPTEHAGVVSRLVALLLAGLSALVVLWAVFALVAAADASGSVGRGWGLVAAGMALVAWSLALGSAALAVSPVSTRLLVLATVLPVGTILLSYLVLAVVTGTFTGP
jgi:hypothetical protein